MRKLAQGHAFGLTTFLSGSKAHPYYTGEFQLLIKRRFSFKGVEDLKLTLILSSDKDKIVLSSVTRSTSMFNFHYHKCEILKI